MLKTIWNAIFTVTGVAAGAIGSWAFLTDPVPKSLDQANAQLARIAESLDTLTSDSADPQGLRDLRDTALNVARGAARPLSEEDAFITQVGTGVFDIPIGMAWDLTLPSGRSVPLVLSQLFSSSVYVYLGGGRERSSVGEVIEVADTDGARCRLLLVGLRRSEGEARFRWRCSGY